MNPSDEASGSTVPDGDGARPGPDVDTEREELRRRVEESEALHVLGLAANRTLEPDEVLTLVARSARSLLGAHYVTVSTHSDLGLVPVAAVGLRGRANSSDPLAERVVATGRALLVGEEGGPAIEELAFHAGEGMIAGLGVPLALFGEIFGALVLGYRRPYAVRPRDTRLALTLAGHAAVAISNARLHRALSDRTEELERANEELRWSAAAKERFFAAMSHELRTPIHSVLGYQSLLLEGMGGELPDLALTFLSNANRATESLLVVINDVLDLSKLDAGKLELSLRACDPVATIIEAIDTVRPLLDRKGLEILTHLPERAEPIVTDGGRVRQILVNLLSNAIKFTDRGHISVELEEEPADGANGERWLLVRVRDSGPGIPADDGERIFHDFEQVAGPGTSAGTGLGLAISRKLARLLGGDLELESGFSPGASFLLRLPSRDRKTGASIA
jgi:signal transduction histidine kinase